MTNEPNPYAPPQAESDVPRDAAAPAGPALHQLELAQLKGAPWTLSVYPTVVRLAPTDGRPARTFDHRGFIEETDLNFALAKGQLQLPKPAPAATVALTPEAVAALRAWLTPALREHLAKALSSQRISALSLGVLWLLPGGGPQGFVRPVSLAVGLGWLAWAAAATLKPHRVLFLVNAALWSSAAISIVFRVIAGSGSPLWLVLLLFFWPLIASRFRAYRFYGPAES